MSDALRDAAFRLMIEAAPDGIVVVGNEGRILFVNSETEALFGYSPAELIGQRVELLIPESHRSMHVIHREIFQERPTRRPMGVGLELAGRRKNGSTFPVEISLSSFHDGDAQLSMAVVRDVTRQRRAEEALRRSEERHRLLNERSENIIFRYRLAPTRGFEYVSSSINASLGYAPEEFYVSDDLIYAVTDGDDRELLRKILNDDQSGRAVMRLHTRNGELRWFDWNVSLVRDSTGVPVALEGTAHDITDRRLAEAERARLEAAVELQAERGRIAGDLHDDTIQSVYALGLGLVAARDDDTVGKESALSRAIEGLNAVIGSLRSYMQQLSGDDDVRPPPESLDSRIGALISPEATTRWTIEVDAALHLAPSLDRHVFLLVKELVSNVQRHAAAAHGTVRVHRDTVGDLLIEVTDDGVGFDRDSVSLASFGLRSIQLRAGTIGAELAIDSTPGAGTRACVTLPASAVSVAPAGPVEPVG